MPGRSGTLVHYASPGVGGFNAPDRRREAQGMEYKEWLAVAIDVGIRVGVRVLGAIVLWIVGRAVINFVGRIITRSLASHHLDPTLGRYIASAVSIALNIVLIIAVLGIFG